MTTITAADVEVLRIARERAESAYAASCRDLVCHHDDARALAEVRSGAQRLYGAQQQYAVALRELGGDVRPVTVPADWVDLALAMAGSAS